MSNLRRVGVVILNWNGLEDTLRCLGSLAHETDDRKSLDIVVVDNGSATNPQTEIQRAAPDVDFVRLDSNIGFAAACNVGAQRCLSRDAEQIVFLNNDTLIPRGTFRLLTAQFLKHPALGLASPLIFDLSDPSLLDFAGAKINFSLGRFQHLHRTALVSVELIESDYITGCCMMISRGALERIGLFDERLFAYFEDVDLSLRAREKGLKIACVPAATILHKGSASTRRNLSQGTTSPLKHYLIARNRTLIVRRYAKVPAKLFYFAFTIPLRLLFYSSAFALKLRWNKLRAIWLGTIDGLRNRSGVPPEASFN